MTKQPKKKKGSAIQSYLRMYKQIYIGDEKFIACPKIDMNYLTNVKWVSKHESFMSVFYTYPDIVRYTGIQSMFYSKKDMTYYVVDAVWVLLLPLFGSQSIINYLYKINTNLVHGNESFEEVKEEKVIHDVPVIIKKEPTSLLEKLTDEIIHESFYIRYGLNQDTYVSMVKSGDYKVVDFARETHILDFHKFMYNEYDLLMRDTMRVLNETGIISQPDHGWQYHYFLSEKSLQNNLGYNIHNKEKNTDYPILYLKGVFTVLQILFEKNLIAEKLIPKLL